MAYSPGISPVCAIRYCAGMQIHWWPTVDPPAGVPIPLRAGTPWLDGGLFPCGFSLAIPVPPIPFRAPKIQLYCAGADSPFPIPNLAALRHAP